MKKILLFLFFLFTLSLKSQNSDTYFAFRMTEDTYEYLDSSGIGRMEAPDSCECVLELSTKFWEFCSKKEAYDSLLLNDLAEEELIDDLMNALKKDFKKTGFNSRDKISLVFIDTKIKRLSNRFYIFNFYRKVRYKITMQIYYRPVLP